MRFIRLALLDEKDNKLRVQYNIEMDYLVIYIIDEIEIKKNSKFKDFNKWSVPIHYGKRKLNEGRVYNF